MDKKAISNWDIIQIVILVFLLLGLIWGLVYIGEQREKERECLRPFAEEYCEEKGLVLKRNNEVVFFCSEDLRSGELRYNYLQSELNYCDAFRDNGE